MSLLESKSLGTLPVLLSYFKLIKTSFFLLSKTPFWNICRNVCCLFLLHFNYLHIPSRLSDWLLADYFNLCWSYSPYSLMLQPSRHTHNWMYWNFSIDILRTNGNKLSSCKSFTWSRFKIPPSAINASVSVWSFYFNMGNPTSCLWFCFICFELSCYYLGIISKLPLSPNHLELSPSL